MKIRLVKKSDGSLALLCDNGYMLQPTRGELSLMLNAAKKINNLENSIANTKGNKQWKTEYPDIVSYPGETLAYVTDNLLLVIVDFTPFNVLFEESYTELEDVLTVKEFAKKYNKSIEQIKVFCRNGRIAGAKKIGRDWLIPHDAAYPEDNRFSSL